MSAIRARVENGRLLVDVPTDLPEGLEVTLAVVDDDLLPSERRALEESLEESYAQADAGSLSDAREAIERLRASARQP